MNEVDRTIGFLDRALEQIESRLDQPDVPLEALEDFKATLDSTRTVVHAIVEASVPGSQEDYLHRSRVRRAAQVCQSVLFGLLDGSITLGTPGLAELRATVAETLEHMDAFAGGANKSAR
jgi:alanyl-tRNA synthetase